MLCGKAIEQLREGDMQCTPCKSLHYIAMNVACVCECLQFVYYLVLLKTIMPFTDTCIKPMPKRNIALATRQRVHLTTSDY